MQTPNMQERDPNTPTPDEAAAAEETATPSAEGATHSEAANLEEALKQAEAKAQEHYDAWLRAAADAENVRKRAQEDVAKAHKFALEKFATELLAVKDSLEAALATENAALASLKSGVELTLKQLATVFERQQIREIDPVGQKFDPHQHEAISMLPSDKEPNTVINVLQKGYTLHDRVIRPALVTVAKPKDA